MTGASGFIGGALAARLIHTDRWDECLFLIRAEHREDGLARIAHVLRRHGVDEVHLERLHLEQILCGDLNTVADWQDDPRLPSIQDVVSSAAVASFGNHPSIWPTNVDGVLAMAHALYQRCKLRRFLHIGTAMACGHQAPIPVPEGYDAGEETDHFLQYTHSKHEAERRLREELPDLPLVVARPSIVVGHSKLGCEPSGSIFWVFRMARALRAFPCELTQQIDVIPVDYCAEALHLLLDKPDLQFDRYHITAGASRACTFGEIDSAIARDTGQAPMDDYQVKEFAELAQMQDSFKDRLGHCNKRIVLRAIRAYGNFAALGMVFDNTRLLAEGMPLPTPLAAYAGRCEVTSAGISIAEQMRFDYK
ncbi:SDR family oxidoreductase [Denitratisoma sp. agr-D3]